MKNFSSCFVSYFNLYCLGNTTIILYQQNKYKIRTRIFTREITCSCFSWGSDLLQGSFQHRINVSVHPMKVYQVTFSNWQRYIANQGQSITNKIPKLQDTPIKTLTSHKSEPHLTGVSVFQLDLRKFIGKASDLCSKFISKQVLAQHKKFKKIKSLCPNIKLNIRNSL